MIKLGDLSNIMKFTLMVIGCYIHTHTTLFHELAHQIICYIAIGGFIFIATIIWSENV